MSADSFIKNNLWLYDWNSFYGKIEIFDFKKTPFRYICIFNCNNVFLWDCMGKGAFIKRMDGCSQKLQYTNTIMEKKQTGGRG